MTEPPFVPLQFERVSLDESQSRARAFYERMNLRRTTRHFSSEPVPRQLIEYAIRTAGTAPSGAHQQPWTFVAVSDPAIKAEIRRAAEEEERAFYNGRAPKEWLEALAPLGTDEHKPHLMDASWVVVLFRQTYGVLPDGSKRTYYYTQESCGIAAGLFIAAVHKMGLVTLTHTPNPHGVPRRTARSAGQREGDARHARRAIRPPTRACPTSCASRSRKSASGSSASARQAFRGVSTSRSIAASAAPENGFWRKCMPSARIPRSVTTSAG